MAGDWIPAQKKLSRTREVLAIAAATGLHRYYVVGLLLDFWAWADDETLDGRLPGMIPETLNALFSGSDSAFWAAVMSAGWLIQRSDGLEVPNFQRWLGQSAKRRLKEAQRKREARAGEDRPSRVRRASASDADKKRTTEQDRREEEKNSPPTPPKGGEDGSNLPRELDTAAFRAAWGEWLEYRRQRRLAKYTEVGLPRVWAPLIAMGAERAIAAIYHSIGKNWQGIFEERHERANEREKPVGRSARISAPAGKYDGVGIQAGLPCPADAADATKELAPPP